MLSDLHRHYAPQIKAREKEIGIPGAMSATSIAELLLFPHHIELHVDFADGTHGMKVIATDRSDVKEVHARLTLYTGLDLALFQAMTGSADYDEIMQMQEAVERL